MSDLESMISSATPEIREMLFVMARLKELGLCFGVGPLRILPRIEIQDGLGHGSGNKP